MSHPLRGTTAIVGIGNTKRFFRMGLISFRARAEMFYHMTFVLSGGT